MSFTRCAVDVDDWKAMNDYSVLNLVVLSFSVNSEGMQAYQDLHLSILDIYQLVDAHFANYFYFNYSTILSTSSQNQV